MKAKSSPNLKLLLLLVPIVVVAISGCTGTSDSGATFGTGIAILNWEPTFSSGLESGDSLQFRLRVQNQGEVTAVEVTPVITGIVPEDWGLPTSQFYGYGIGQSFDMMPPNRIQNTPGEIRQETYDARAPSLPFGVTQTFTPQIRVYYTYRTTASKLITLVNEQELKRLQDKGQTLSSKDTVSSAGPLKVTINAGKFLKSKDVGVSRAFPITVDIQNVGGGVVSTMNQPEMDYVVDIAFQTTSGRLTLSGCQNQNTQGGVTLWKGQSATVTCTATIGQVLATEEANIKVVLDYDYYVDASTAVTVTGTEEGYYIG